MPVTGQDSFGSLTRNQGLESQVSLPRHLSLPVEFQRVTDEKQVEVEEWRKELGVASGTCKGEEPSVGPWVGSAWKGGEIAIPGPIPSPMVPPCAWMGGLGNEV